MRKILIAFLVLLSLVLQGCSALTFKCELSSSDIAARCIKDSRHDVSIYMGRGTPYDTLSKEKMNLLYGFSDAADKCIDYTVYLSRDDLVWEIHIYRVVSAYDNEEVIKMLSQRQNMISMAEIGEYSPESLERARESLVFSKKNIVCLLITENNEKYKEIICKCV